MIKKLKLTEVEKITKIIQDYKYKQYYWISNLTNEQLSNYTIFQLINILKKDGIVLVYEEKNDIKGLLSFLKIEWDTKYFGYGIGRIEHLIAVGGYKKELEIKNRLITELLKLIKKYIPFLSIRVNVGELSTIHSLCKNGFNLVTTELMFAWFKYKLKEYPFYKMTNLPCKLRKYKNNDLPKLIEFAKYFTTNRFYQDTAIPKDKAEGVYKEWIRNACCGTFSGNDEVKVAEKDNKIIGFTTAKIDNQVDKFFGFNIGIPGLVAVLPEYRGLGINKHLIGYAIKSLFKNSEIVCAPSHITNLVMIKSETKTGAEWVTSEYIFHKWL